MSSDNEEEKQCYEKPKDEFDAVVLNAARQEAYDALKEYYTQARYTLTRGFGAIIGIAAIFYTYIITVSNSNPKDELLSYLQFFLGMALILMCAFISIAARNLYTHYHIYSSALIFAAQVLVLPQRVGPPL